MAKRMTDSEKWRREWFQELSPRLKLFWIYLVDSCDLAGIWHENYKLACFSLGEAVSFKDLEHHFAGKFIRIDRDKLFFPAFVEFQYGKLSSGSKPHLAVIRQLERYEIDPNSLTLPKGYTKGIDTLKDKDKDQDQDQDQERGCGGKQNLQPLYVAPSRAPIAGMTEATAEWLETLKHYKINRPAEGLIPGEDLALASALKKFGVQNVILALTGARKQKPGKDFDPAQYVSLRNYLDPDRIDRLINLGSGAEASGADNKIDWSKVNLS